MSQDFSEATKGGATKQKSQCCLIYPAMGLLPDT